MFAARFAICSPQNILRWIFSSHKSLQHIRSNYLQIVYWNSSQTICRNCLQHVHRKVFAAKLICIPIANIFSNVCNVITTNVCGMFTVCSFHISSNYSQEGHFVHKGKVYFGVLTIISPIYTDGLQEMAPLEFKNGYP